MYSVTGSEVVQKQIQLGDPLVNVQVTESLLNKQTKEYAAKWFMHRSEYTFKMRYKIAHDFYKLTSWTLAL